MLILINISDIYGGFRVNLIQKHQRQTRMQRGFARWIEEGCSFSCPFLKIYTASLKLICRSLFVCAAKRASLDTVISSNFMCFFSSRMVVCLSIWIRLFVFVYTTLCELRDLACFYATDNAQYCTLDFSVSLIFLFELSSPTTKKKIDKTNLIVLVLGILIGQLEH